MFKSNDIYRSMRRIRIINAQIDKMLDAHDVKILELLLVGRNNKQISQEIKIPLSTVQRRSRNLIANNIIKSKVELNYEILGLKTGLLHIYLEDGDTHEILQKILNFDKIESVEIHIGDSDLLGNVVYRDSKDLLDLISKTKKLKGVEKIVWSERIFQSAHKEISDLTNSIMA